MSGTPEERAMLAFRTRPYGCSSPYDAFKAAQEYTLTDIVNNIRCPLLITDPEAEHFWPGQSQRLYDALPGPKTLAKFTAAQG